MHPRKKIAQFSRRIRQMGIPLVMLLIIIYSFFQMLSSERGIIAWIDLRAHVDEITYENDLLSEQISRTEVDIQKLKAQSIDIDYLDEMIRRNYRKCIPMKQ